MSKNMVFMQHAREGILLKEFEKWRAIRASVGGVGGVLAWVTCCVGGVLAWVAC